MKYKKVNKLAIKPGSSIRSICINNSFNNSPIKKWIKLIPTDNTISFDKYKRKNHFIHVANIVLDNDVFTTGKKRGQRMRNTLIQFISTISHIDFTKKKEWLYIFTINGIIVKIGGTRSGIKGRTISYLCGHHIRERGKSGDCSKTNGFIYNTLLFYLQQGCKIQMYGYELPVKEITINVFDEEMKIPAQTYNIYESIFINDFIKEYCCKPYLCENSDPDYRQGTHIPFTKGFKMGDNNGLQN